MRKRKLLAFAAALALLAAAALPAWGAERKPPVESQVYAKDGILYAIYHPFSLPVRVQVPPVAPVEGQMVIHRNHRATFRRVTTGGEYTFDFAGKSCAEYAILIAHFAQDTQISYQVGNTFGGANVPATAGQLRISWPELEITRVGSFDYTLSGSGDLEVTKISEETTADGARVERYRYWPADAPDALMDGSLAVAFLPSADQTGTIGFTFPFCSPCVATWLARSPAHTGPPPGPTPGGPGSGGLARLWPLLPAAGAGIVLGWALGRRAVDVWLAREDEKLYVRRGRRGPRRVRAVLNFAGEDARELVLGRGETRQVEAPAGWRAVEVTTPGRRNRGQPVRLEREASDDVRAQA